MWVLWLSLITRARTRLTSLFIRAKSSAIKDYYPLSSLRSHSTWRRHRRSSPRCRAAWHLQACVSSSGSLTRTLGAGCKACGLILSRLRWSRSWFLKIIRWFSCPCTSLTRTFSFRTMWIALSASRQVSPLATSKTHLAFLSLTLGSDH